MSNSDIPKQCLACARFDSEVKLCRTYQELPGQGSRSKVISCDQFLKKELDELRLLALYVRETEAGRSISNEVQLAVDNVLSDHDNKLKLYILGVARRKVKQMTKMVDLTDTLLDNLTSLDQDTIGEMTASQKIRLLSELNNSVNKDLSLLMKILQADDALTELQINLTQNNLSPNASSEETNDLADDMLELGGASRDKIRRAFNSILYQIEQEDIMSLPEVDYDEEDEPIEEEESSNTNEPRSK